MKSLIIIVLIFHYVLCRNLKTDLHLDKLNEYSNQLDEASKPVPLKIKPDDITLLIHTKTDPSGVEIPLSDAHRVTEVTSFNLKLKTVFFVHGWMNKIDEKSCPVVKDALLQYANVNVILVDWDECSSNIDYLISKSCVPDVGKYVAEFVKTLSQTYGYSLSDITVVGHSLGAHIAGHIGKNTNGALGVIVGLDPAGPFYSKDDRSARLTEDDAKFVQAIHTDASVLGINFNVGNIDFWPNGGYSQPGCLLDMNCSHRKAWKYYAESLSNNGFYAKQCDSYSHYEDGKCATHSKSLFGGINIDTKAAGEYYLETNADSPFAKGDV